MFSYTDTTDVVKDLLFFVDSSGSMSRNELVHCYSEINGAIQQFKRHIDAKMAFFDTSVYEPLIPFDSITDITKIKVEGRGGTLPNEVFKFCDEYKRKGGEIAGVIIFTDGEFDYDDLQPFDTPLLWIFTTHDNNPPFGLHTTIEIENS